MSDKILTTEQTETTEARKGINELTEMVTSCAIASIHDAQLLRYLKLGGWKIGPLINFNVQLLKRGIHRKVVGRADEVSL